MEANNENAELIAAAICNDFCYMGYSGGKEELTSVLNDMIVGGLSPHKLRENIKRIIELAEERFGT